VDRHHGPKEVTDVPEDNCKRHECFWAAYDGGSLNRYNRNNLGNEYRRDRRDAEAQKVGEGRPSEL